jgi:hypothetical protein
MRDELRSLHGLFAGEEQVSRMPGAQREQAGYPRPVQNQELQSHEGK